MTEGADLTFSMPAGVFTLRVGAVIVQDGRVLMVKNAGEPHYYTVGGRVKLHETLEQAVLRETYEETGLRFEIDRLVWVQQNFFQIDGRPYHEVAFLYLMNADGVTGICGGSSTDHDDEQLIWLPIDRLSDYEVYPPFFKTSLNPLPGEVAYVVTVE